MEEMRWYAVAPGSFGHSYAPKEVSGGSLTSILCAIMRRMDLGWQKQISGSGL